MSHGVIFHLVMSTHSLTHTLTFYPGIVNNEHALALYSRTIYSKVCNFQKYVESVVFCCILKKNKIQITLINQKLSRHQSIYWCIGVLGTARIQKYIVSTFYTQSLHKHVCKEHSANFTAQEFCHLWTLWHLTVMRSAGEFLVLCWLLIYCLLFVMFQYFIRAKLMN